MAIRPEPIGSCETCGEPQFAYGSMHTAWCEYVRELREQVKGLQERVFKLEGACAEHGIHKFPEGHDMSDSKLVVGAEVDLNLVMRISKVMRVEGEDARGDGFEVTFKLGVKENEASSGYRVVEAYISDAMLGDVPDGVAAFFRTMRGAVCDDILIMDCQPETDGES